MKLIPSVIQLRFTHRPNLVKIVDNIGWLFFDKFLRMGFGLFVGVWVARYLGPDQFGMLSFAMAFVGLFGAIAGLGLKRIVVRDIVRDPVGKDATLGTAALLKGFGGLSAYSLMLATIFWLRPNDPLAISLVAICGLSLLFQASQVAEYWFASQVSSKYIVWMQISGFFVFAAIKIILILNKAPLIAFAWTTVAEAFVVALLTLLIFWLRGPRLRQFRFTLMRAKSLLADSWPLLLSAISVTIYMRIDQIMLGQMVGDEAVATYSVAVRISEIWYFILIAIVSSAFPRLTVLHNADRQLFVDKFLAVLRSVNFVSLLFGLVISLSSCAIVEFTYGNDYKNSCSSLIVLAWVGVFVGVGLMRSKYLILEDLQLMQSLFLGMGAIVNIVLNFFLIPLARSDGAALATLLSYICTVFFFPLIFPRLWKLQKLIAFSFLFFPKRFYKL